MSSFLACLLYLVGSSLEQAPCLLLSITLRLTWVWDQEKASTHACPIGTKDLEWVVGTLSNRTTRHHITKVQDHQSFSFPGGQCVHIAVGGQNLQTEIATVVAGVP